MNNNTSTIINLEDFYNINEWITGSRTQQIYFNLLLRGSIGGFEASTFHRNCDSKPNLLVLILTTQNRKFGGYTKIPFTS